MAQDVEDAVGGSPADDELLVARALRVVEPCKHKQTHARANVMEKIKNKKGIKIQQSRLGQTEDLQDIYVQ